MKIIQGIKATGRQRLRITADSGDVVEIVLYFRPAAQQWYIDVISGDFTLNGYRVCRSPNMLCQYDNLISFGIGCETTDRGEPFLVNDFSSGRASLVLINKAEIEELNNIYVSLRQGS